MTKESSQKFIARNRAPRVQIEYEVEMLGADRKVELPFVLGVMSDLSGNQSAVRPPIEERRFLEIDADTFDARMKAIGPRLAVTVRDHLSGDGDEAPLMGVTLAFERLEDFSPGAIARSVEPLRKLLDARQRLADLLTYMDGKAGSEGVLAEILGDRALLRAVAAGEARSDEGAA